MTQPTIEVLNERINNLLTDVKIMRSEVDNKVPMGMFTWVAGGVSGLAIILILFLIGQQFSFQKDFADTRDMQNAKLATLTGQVQQISSTLNSIVHDYNIKVTP